MFCGGCEDFGGLPRFFFSFAPSSVPLLVSSLLSPLPLLGASDELRAFLLAGAAAPASMLAASRFPACDCLPGGADSPLPAPLASLASASAASALLGLPRLRFGCGLASSSSLLLLLLLSLLELASSPSEDDSDSDSDEDAAFRFAAFFGGLPGGRF